MRAAPASFEEWVAWRERRTRRRATIELCAQAVGSQVLCLSLFAQTYRGHLSHSTYSPYASWAAAGAAVVVAVLFVAHPPTAGALMTRVFRVFGAVVNAATAVVLATVFVCSWPLAVVVGRRRLRVEHPGSAPWVGTGTWQASRWVPKRSEADAAVGRRRNTLVRLLGYFVARRNLFMLVVTLLLLIAVSLSVLTHTPYIAPFVYSLF